jgi:hypothetical protein
VASTKPLAPLILLSCRIHRSADHRVLAIATAATRHCATPSPPASPCFQHLVLLDDPANGNANAALRRGAGAGVGEVRVIARSEAELLQAWFRVVVTLDPDVLLGDRLNSDLLFLARRAQALGLQGCTLGGRDLRFGGSDGKVSGRVTLDLSALLNLHLRGATTNRDNVKNYDYNGTTSSCMNPVASRPDADCHQATVLAAFLKEQDATLRERGKREGLSLPFSAPMGTALLEAARAGLRTAESLSLVQDLLGLSQAHGVSLQAWLHRGPPHTAVQQMLRVAKIKGLLLPAFPDGMRDRVAQAPTPTKPPAGNMTRRGPVVRLVFSPPMLPSIVAAFNISPDTFLAEVAALRLHHDCHEVPDAYAHQPYVRSPTKRTIPTGDAYFVKQVVATGAVAGAGTGGGATGAAVTDNEGLLSALLRPLLVPTTEERGAAGGWRHRASDRAAQCLLDTATALFPSVPVVGAASVLCNLMLQRCKDIIECAFAPEDSFSQEGNGGDQDAGGGAEVVSSDVTGLLVSFGRSSRPLPALPELGKEVAAMITRTLPAPLQLHYSAVLGGDGE